VIQGQINVRDAVNRSISFTAPNGKQYTLNSTGLAVLFVRPRGWHLPESHILVDGDVLSGSLVDFGLYFYHNAHNLVKQGTGPYFYLPKMEGHKEARLWNDIFIYSQKRLGIPSGTIRATVLIETILAAFEMDEILYELREHSAGLNCGRWDYIFSTIKKFRNNPKFVLPDRAQVTMNTPFMANYVRLLIQTCHRRGVHAMGGMAAQIPVQNDEAANKAAMDKVYNDKLQEVKRGHDGTWVAHPALIPIAKKVFDEYMKGPNQISTNPGDNRPVTASELLDLGPKGTITSQGLSGNIDVGICYTEAWLRGLGCVPLHNLMEDAATAEISRCQLWQWIKHGATLNDGQKITKQFIAAAIKKEADRIKNNLGAETYNKRKFALAVKLFEQSILSDRLDDFLTLVCYPHITTYDNKKQQSANIKAKL
jgi:malate synthase